MIWYQIAVLEEQRNEAEDEAKASDKPDINNDLDDKPDINDVPMEESQVCSHCCFLACCSSFEFVVRASSIHRVKI